MSVERDVVASCGEVSLGRFVLGYEDAVQRWAADPVVTEFLPWGPNTPAQTRAFLRQASIPSSDRLDLAVIADGEVIGSAAVWTTSPKHLTGEIGYTLSADRWGRGIGTVVARMLLELGFARLGLRRIAATCDVGNLASARVLEKAGMEREGTLRSYLVVDGARRDHHLYAFLPE